MGPVPALPNDGEHFLRVTEAKSTTVQRMLAAARTLDGRHADGTQTEFLAFQSI